METSDWPIRKPMIAFVFDTTGSMWDDLEKGMFFLNNLWFSAPKWTVMVQSGRSLRLKMDGLLWPCGRKEPYLGGKWFHTIKKTIHFNPLWPSTFIQNRSFWGTFFEIKKFQKSETRCSENFAIGDQKKNSTLIQLYFNPFSWSWCWARYENEESKGIWKRTS